VDAPLVLKGKWTLSKESLDAFLSRLNPEPELAGREYENIRLKLLTFFRCHGCWDAEVLVDETIDRVIRRNGEIEIRELMAFILGVARRVASECHHKAYREVPLEEVAEPSQGDVDEEADEIAAAVRLECLEECIKRLEPKDQELISEYYMGAKTQKIENKKKLAQQFGITTAALRVRAFRVRERVHAELAPTLHATTVAAPGPCGVPFPYQGRQGGRDSCRRPPVSAPTGVSPLTGQKAVHPVDHCYGCARRSA
jgi:DNA-directed RNA polymerase specialized sigma24 family protein